MILNFSKEAVFYTPQLFCLIAALSGFLVFSAYNRLHKSSGASLSNQISYFFVLSYSFFLLLLIPYCYFSWEGSLSLVASAPFFWFYSVLALILSLFSIFIYVDYTKNSDLNHFEVPFLFFVVVFSVFVLGIAEDLLTMYLALELQALSLFVLAACRTNSTYSTEAGLKYFVLGSFASALMLLGITVLYSLTGLLNLNEFVLLLSGAFDSSFYYRCVLFGFVVLVCGLLFKVGAAPFHFWVPDVYTGSSVSIAAFFALVPKLAGWIVLVKLSVYCLTYMSTFFSDFFIISSFLSLFIGTFGAIYQNSLKRVLAYSAIGHTGYLLLSLSSFSSVGYVSNIFYLITYSLSLLPVFLIISGYFYKNTGSASDSLHSVRLFYKRSPILGFILVSSVFSMAGVPPFSGFFGKFAVFLSIISQDYFLTGLLALVLSAGSAAYYLRLVRLVAFERKDEGYGFFVEQSRISSYIIVVVFILNLLFFFWGVDLLLFLTYYSNLFV